MTGNAQSYLRVLLPFSIVCLSLALFPSTFETMFLLGRVETTLLANRDDLIAFREYSIPRGGEYVLPPEVQTTIALMRTFGVKSFQYSEGFRRNGGMMQRLVEGAYPIKVSSASPYLVLLEGEPIPAGMKILARGGGVILASRT